MFYTAQQESPSALDQSNEGVHSLGLVIEITIDSQISCSNRHWACTLRGLDFFLFFHTQVHFCLSFQWILPLVECAKDVYWPLCVALQSSSSLNTIGVCSLLFSILTSLKLQQDQSYLCPPFKSVSEPGVQSKMEEEEQNHISIRKSWCSQLFCHLSPAN